ncbi:ABC transporter permease [Xylanimonas ulmi]|uniref:NitT/TauT family transport system permease protein n=1 Tax=Xylanimonas ulmi TaxID=228973 RepID=A0A4Q7LYN2_9MICO|nr:ABC transporter permease subunit [Xylanibacterium ulmi]RZS60385.1 NitT/TauT family transport system permease protein [Xylanibacterium ulmi]
MSVLAPDRPRRRLPQRRMRSAALGATGVLALALAWEAYKAVAPADGVVVGGARVLPRSSDVAMPHLWDMVTRALEPVNSSPTAQPLWLAVLGACLFSLGVAAVGWLVGVVVGLGVAALMQRFRTAESALAPWVVLSQTVPLIALAPLVKRWGAQLQLGPVDWQDWMSVAVIASYLAFFPVSVGALRGLASAQAVHIDLMRSYGVGWWRTLLTVRLPASVPHLLPALYLAAANAVVGTIVAEVSTGLRGGVGRMIVEFGASGSSDPAKQWSPIAGAVLLGLLATGVVRLIALALRRYHSTEVS